MSSHWYSNPNTNHYQYSASNPGSPWIDLGTSLGSPTISSVKRPQGLTGPNLTPASGPVNTLIVITGTNFGDGATVSIGGVSATATVVNSNVIAAKAPAHANGLVSISVQNPDTVVATSSNIYTYAAAAATAVIVPFPTILNSVSWGIQRFDLVHRQEEQA
jgi:hypothetical protein